MSFTIAKYEFDRPFATIDKLTDKQGIYADIGKIEGEFYFGSMQFVVVNINL
jgi:hypothetical protein